MRILVLGGYGLIGAEVMHTLLAAGFQTVGFGRDASLGIRLFPHIKWIEGDLAKMVSAEDWLPVLGGVDAVVNCAGALQEGSRDQLVAVHERAIAGLVSACQECKVRKFLQISVPGAELDSSLPFLSTKAAGDAVVRASKLEWTILKPGLVLAQGAYGGTALLRALAAFPLIQPIVLASAKMQTVAAADVAGAVSAVLQNQVKPLRDYELMEDSPHRLLDLLIAIRQWAGYGKPCATWYLPRMVGYGIAHVADMAGWLGWRSPMRTTALRVLEAGVTGNARPWCEAGGSPLRSLSETLASLPATTQERIYGRVQLVFPLLLISLAVFWIASGMIAIGQSDQAVAVLHNKVSPGWAKALVLGGALLDIIIGLSLLVRRWVRRAALASIVIGGTYLFMGTWLTPQLWLDPMGVFVKVIPAMALAIAVAALVEER